MRIDKVSAQIYISVSISQIYDKNSDIVKGSSGVGLLSKPACSSHTVTKLAPHLGKCNFLDVRCSYHHHHHHLLHHFMFNLSSL